MVRSTRIYLCPSGAGSSLGRWPPADRASGAIGQGECAKLLAMGPDRDNADHEILHSAELSHKPLSTRSVGDAAELDATSLHRKCDGHENDTMEAEV